MKEMALVAALAVFASLASALADEEASLEAKELTVTCDNKGDLTPPGNVEITVRETTLTLTCPDTYTALPAPKEKPTDQTVFNSDACATEVPLKPHCEGATGEIVKGNKWVLKLSFPTVPSDLADFYLKCEPPPKQREDNQPCKVHVVVQSKTQPGDNGSSNGEGSQPQGPGQPGGSTGVQTCLRENKIITVRVSQIGSVAQFACESGSTLYPTEPNKIFSKDCKTRETLKDMTRTQTTGATSARGDGAAPTYTLKADKKPAKKTLCYLCATAGTSAEKPGPAENYCTIYVESGAAGTQFGLSFIVALALPCVPALFQFT